MGKQNIPSRMQFAWHESLLWTATLWNGTSGRILLHVHNPRCGPSYQSSSSELMSWLFFFASAASSSANRLPRENITRKPKQNPPLPSTDTRRIACSGNPFVGGLRNQVSCSHATRTPLTWIRDSRCLRIGGSGSRSDCGEWTHFRTALRNRCHERSPRGRRKYANVR